MKKVMIIMLLLVILMTGVVSAETIDIHEHEQIREESYFEPTHMIHHYVGRINTAGNPISAPFSLIVTTNVTNNNASITHNEVDVDIEAPNNNTVYATGRCGYYINPGENNSQIYLYIDTGGIPDGGNYHIVDANKQLEIWATLDRMSGLMHSNDVKPWPTHPYLLGPDNSPILAGNYVIYSNKDFRHNITYSETELTSGVIDTVIVNRNIDGVYYNSTVQIYNKNGLVIDNTDTTDTVTSSFSSDYRPYIVKIYGDVLDKWLTYTLYDPAEEPTPTTVTVYIRNSQTGAAIANSNVAIDALVNGEYYPVANTTEPSGIFTITLQPTGGGQPNPDGYRLIATADGYNNPMPVINFTVTDSKKYIYCYLDPIAGGPENENNTFIDFYVRDLSANPVSGATVKFGKYTLITNSQGYTVFEVPKNTAYIYTVSKSGYGPVTGNANIGANDRYIINAVIGPAVTPTTPTAIPTATQTGPTPTLTAPTGEPVSNWLEWFAAHFGMILGGGVEIGKIFMWLCFTIPIGVYVGKEAKAGAAGFMAGAGIVTLFFVIIGWVPIWLVILLALIIGLMYLKIFNAPDNGGGR